MLTLRARALQITSVGTADSVVHCPDGGVVVELTPTGVVFPPPARTPPLLWTSVNSVQVTSPGNRVDFSEVDGKEQQAAMYTLIDCEPGAAAPAIAAAICLVCAGCTPVIAKHEGAPTPPASWAEVGALLDKTTPFWPPRPPPPTLDPAVYAALDTYAGVATELRAQGTKKSLTAVVRETTALTDGLSEVTSGVIDRIHAATESRASTVGGYRRTAVGAVAAAASALVAAVTTATEEGDRALRRVEESAGKVAALQTGLPAAAAADAKGIVLAEVAFSVARLRAFLDVQRAGAA